ncbi:NADP-dependent oxidoreductase domain-containing protein [Penicillium nucicola]|uniref:NADP-dependent oxidoreductase domain-containing protein n=1 Tax=Penicillium nucicola TaxID=1850975 RepID=UPI002544FEB0|nr:NADP-dependent oxidoreductase domain-containing protein [Penicillium nucicola]KAJ5770261.1 NADP-dependent oxidoreductase domain-containing protein [Penicillium nucicola]
MAQKLSLTSTQKIHSGYEIPILGYGLYQVPGPIAEDVTQKALKAGYRHIDSAAVYENEKECISAVEKAGLNRSDIFLTTKVLPQATGYEAARRSIEDSLKKANTDYFDLILLHAPFGGKEGRLGAWRALAESQKAGKARSIGVSNFGIHHLEELEEYIESTGDGRIEVCQYELHPWLGRADLVDWLRKRGVVIEAYSPLARGSRMDEPVLRAISKKYNKNPAQILIRWSLQKGFVPLPKSATPERIQENTDVFDFELDEDDMKALHTDEYAPSTWDPSVQQD